MQESTSVPSIPDPAFNGEVAAWTNAQADTRAQVRNKSLGFQLLFGLANMVMGLTSVTIYQALLPKQVALLDPANKVNLIALISALGALGAVIANPLAGALSDRTTSLLGRRRPWIMGGACVAVVALIILALAKNIVTLAIGGILIQIVMNIVLAALTAIIPDQVPLRQRATVSAFAGMAPLVGGVVGLILITQVVRSLQLAYYLLAGISFALLLLFALVVRDQPVSRETVPTLSFKQFFATFWVNPVKHPDFGYTFLARFLVFVGYTSTIMFTYFYLQDAVHYSQDATQLTQGVAIFQIIVVSSLIVTAIIGGIISDKIQRRKPFVIGASLIMMVALLMLALFPIWSVILVAAAVLGLGFGAYLSVDLALASQVLPAENNRAKDMGFMNTAIFLPLIISPLLASVTIDMFHGPAGYTAFFSVAAFATLCASVLILPIKTVR